MIPLVFYYNWLNRFSFNALAGAIDAAAGLAGLPIRLAQTRDAFRGAASALVARHGRAVAALSLLTPQFEEMRSLARELRADHSGRLTIVAGGPHATACPEAVLESCADIVCLGEAESSFPALLERLLGDGDFRDIPGIAFVRDGRTVRNPGPPPVALDSYGSFSPSRGMFGPIEITRGCAFACNFCQTSRIFGTGLRHRSIGSIVRHAEALGRGRSRIVRLLSPNAFSYGSPDGIGLNPEALRELLAALRDAVSPRGRILFAHFPSEARPEHVTDDTLDLLEEYADNDEIVIGAQSGSPRMLEACHRRHTVEDVVRAVAAARRHGYKVIVDFIFGLPGEEPSDVASTLDLIGTLTGLGARIHPHGFMPLPGTPFAASPPSGISPAVLQALEEIRKRRGMYVNREEILRGFESGAGPA